MGAFRHLLAQRQLAVLLCAASLLLKLLVPTGYMIENRYGVVDVVPCSGIAPQPVAAAAGDGDMATPHGTMPDHAPSKDHGKVEMPCAYSGLSAQMLGAVDPILLAVALAMVAAMALFATPGPALPAAAYLRPPLRGPPLPLT